VLEKTIFHWISEYGYAAITGLLMFGIAGLPVPDETLLTFSGYLVFKTQLHLLPTMLAAFLGSAMGITLSYVLGRTFGYGLIHRYGRYIHITDARLQKAHRWMEHAGAWALMFGYYLPGVRHLTAYAAGTSRLELRVFALFAYAGALLWSATFVVAGYWMGEEWSRIAGSLHTGAWIVTALFVAGVIIIIGMRRTVLRQREGKQTRAGTKKKSASERER
jgi:membrane protein DedA with SNARE-associated domain